MFWLFYFLVSIGVVSLLFCMFLVGPLYVLEKFFPRLSGSSERAVQVGVRVLLNLQPWYRADVQIRLPEKNGGLLLVSNHRSHLDAFILLSRVPGIRILAKKSLFAIPVLSWMMRATRQIGVERGRLEAWAQAMETVRRQLLLGETVHIFPEMTRCAPGYHGLQHFTLAPFLVAVQEDVPVVPVVFRNTDAAWPKGLARLRFRRPVEARTLAPIRGGRFATAEDLKNEVFRQLSEAMA